ncbi:MAG: sugar ABC transporter ATP-binding protein [Clostridiales Family XIII bacterium]|jgi:ribose transport system ATP-binding protein|nr:sugar ABC transporter ATP-binding protein [Clostridiales Family XIII bacterium]
MQFKLTNISKIFPGVKALDDVSVSFESGEIHALLGENGAGKSTAMKIMCGIYAADGGELELDGRKLLLRDYSDAIREGISIVHQEIQIIPEFSVAENIFLDKMNGLFGRGFISWRRLNEKAREYMDIVGLNVDPSEVIGALSPAQKQLAQIAKALSSNAKVIMFDEPTSSLTEHEAGNLFKIIRELKQQGKIILFISHKLEEVLELCDQVSVLRDGKLVGTRYCKGMSKDDIIQMMIGRSIQHKDYGVLPVDREDVVLECRGISRKGSFSDVSFQLRRGEILGFYGLVGAGRTELAKIIIGEDTCDAGEIFINGRKARIRDVADSAGKFKIGYVSENRKEEGLILEASVRENIGITVWEDIARTFFKIIDIRKEKELVQKVIDLFKIKVADSSSDVESLSGGNQQKICIGKWIIKGCDILIIDEPTVGVDVGAKETIHQLIWNLAKEEGKSIILISSDMPELCELSRRILVFKNFGIVGEIDNINDRGHSYEELSPLVGEYLM